MTSTPKPQLSPNARAWAKEIAIGLLILGIGISVTTAVQSHDLWGALGIALVVGVIAVLVCGVGWVMDYLTHS